MAPSFLNNFLGMLAFVVSVQGVHAEVSFASDPCVRPFKISMLSESDGSSTRSLIFTNGADATYVINFESRLLADFSVDFGTLPEGATIEPLSSKARAQSFRLHWQPSLAEEDLNQVQSVTVQLVYKNSPACTTPLHASLNFLVEEQGTQIPQISFADIPQGAIAQNQDFTFHIEVFDPLGGAPELSLGSAANAASFDAEHAVQCNPTPGLLESGRWRFACRWDASVLSARSEAPFTFTALATVQDRKSAVTPSPVVFVQPTHAAVKTETKPREENSAPAVVKAADKDLYRYGSNGTHSVSEPTSENGKAPPGGGGMYGGGGYGGGEGGAPAGAMASGVGAPGSGSSSAAPPPQALASPYDPFGDDPFGGGGGGEAPQPTRLIPSVKVHTVHQPTVARLEEKARAQKPIARHKRRSRRVNSTH